MKLWLRICYLLVSLIYFFYGLYYLLPYMGRLLTGNIYNLNIIGYFQMLSFIIIGIIYLLFSLNIFMVNKFTHSSLFFAIIFFLLQYNIYLPRVWVVQEIGLLLLPFIFLSWLLFVFCIIIGLSKAVKVKLISKSNIK